MVTRPATDTQEGEQEKTCTACGHKIKSTIPVTGGATDPIAPSKPDDPKVPDNPNTPDKSDNANVTQTGDTSNMVLWFALMGASAAGLGGVLLLYKRRRNKAE